MMPLGLLSTGGKAEIVTIRESGASDCGRSCDCRVEDMGLRVGKTVEMLNNAGGPVLLRVDESRIAIARGLAMKIMVREVGK
jgi:ferrous iron transport protein A